MECGKGQICISTPVEFSALVRNNDKTVSNSTVKFSYSSCSRNTTVDCAKIGDKINNIFNGTEFTKKLAKINGFGKQMNEWGKKMDEWGTKMEKEMDETKFSGFGAGLFSAPGSIFKTGWLGFGKRDEDAAKAVGTAKSADTKVKTGSSSTASLNSNLMILRGCDESTIKRA